MPHASRRKFLACSSALALSSAAYQRLAAATRQAAKPNLGLIGCGGRSKSLVPGFQGEAQFSWICDPDSQHAEELRAVAGAAQVTSDLRRVLDDKSVTGVVIATPDHWHAPAAILACQAGKHVYVEKPCSHNLREGRLLVDAARKAGVVVQHGTQSRSNPLIVNAIQLIREGAIGDVLMAKAWNVQRRANIGHAKPTAPPDHLDYDLWVGPAEQVPFQSNRFHYTWHWWYNFGTGDIGNDGTHELDIARWGLSVAGLPTTAAAIGGKYYFDDDQQFPDTATCIFEWPGNGQVKQRKQLTFEMRIWSKNLPYGCDAGIEFFGTQGMLFVSKRGKLQLFNDGNQLVPDPQPSTPPPTPKNHQVDFLEAIVHGRRPSADIQLAHDSVALVHLANISVRTGQTLHIDPQREQILNSPAASQLLGRTYRQGGHWSVPN